LRSLKILRNGGGGGGSGGAPPATGLYGSLAVWFMISPIPIILFSSLFISMTRILACGGIFLDDISLGHP
jgi:hypothetical protein